MTFRKNDPGNPGMQDDSGYGPIPYHLGANGFGQNANIAPPVTSASQQVMVRSDDASGGPSAHLMASASHTVVMYAAYGSGHPSAPPVTSGPRPVMVPAAHVSDPNRANTEPHLTYPKVVAILNLARGEAERLYSVDIPALHAQLEFQNGLGHKRCAAGQESPQDILDGSIWMEWKATSAWNLHRLGAGTVQKMEDVNNEEAKRMWGAPFVDVQIPDLEKFFPIRLAATKLGVKYKTPPRLEYWAVHPLVQAAQRRRVKAEAAKAKAEREAAGEADPETTAPAVDVEAPEAQATRDTGAPSAQPDAVESKKRTRRPRQRKLLKAPDVPSAIIPGKHNRFTSAPSHLLPFPTGLCNITIAELICFFPNWLKVPDVVERAISNGGSSAVFQTMLSKMRYLGEREYLSNAVYRLFDRPMQVHRKAKAEELGLKYEKWTVGNHVPLPDHDGHSVSITGFHTPPARKNHPKYDTKVAFKSLAINVVQFPTGDEALDLTRCVQYHLQHPDEDWSFPDDFERLVQQLGGPTMPTAAHEDRAAFSRWETPQSRHGRKLMAMKRDSRGRLQKDSSEPALEDEADDKQSLDGDGHPPGKRRKTDTPLPRALRDKPVVYDSESSDEGGTYRGSRRANAFGHEIKKDNLVRRSDRNAGHPGKNYSLLAGLGTMTD
jgi:hypothetical protein